jgi:hypothetical protein
MPNWVYNRLTVCGEPADIKLFAKSISSKGLVIDFPKLSTVVPRTWDIRDEGLARLENIKDGLIYFFDTAWNPRPEMIRDLSKVFPKLQFELYFTEEGERFAGALLCKKGLQMGEAYLGDEELEDYLVSSDEWGDDADESDSEESLDTEALEVELLKRARAGSVVDWDARKAKLELLRSDFETATLTRIRSTINDLTTNAKLHPPKKKITDEKLCKAIRSFESPFWFRKHANLDLVPKAYLSEWVGLQLCMTNDENWKKLPKSLQTQSFWNKYIKCKETLSVYYNPPLKRVPTKFRSDSLVRYALKHDMDALGALKPSERNHGRCLLAVQCYYKQLKLVPQPLRSEKLCRIAIIKGGVSLQFVPKILRTQTLCDLATYKGKGYNAMAIEFVPAKLVTAKMFEYFIKSPRGRAYEDSLNPKWIPKTFRTFELLRELLPTQPKLLSIVEPQMFEEFLSIDGYALRLVQSSGWNFNWFEHIPEKVRTKELYEYVIQNHGAFYFKSLPDLYKTKTLSIEAFGKYGSKILPHVPNATFDQDFCEKILAKDIILQTWNLNSESADLKEFVQDIPAMHIPKNLWSDSLVKLARNQTEFSVIAFPINWVSNDDFDKIIVQDKNLFDFFQDKVKIKFKSKMENILSQVSEIDVYLVKIRKSLSHNPAFDNISDVQLLEILEKYIEDKK